VNWQHFRAFLWLRWRLTVNQMRRGGTANIVALIIVTVGAAILAVVMAASMFLVGLYALGSASPAVLMYVWDGLVAAFLLSWAIGLMVELQRAEALSLNKFLHLPVSLRSAFVINYLSSLVCPCMIFFLPAMLGLAVGLALSRGSVMLLTFPVLGAFLLAVTALTYQFQGWLAALMSNPRRRRTIIVVATLTVILLAQVPNLINVIRPWDHGNSNEATARHLDQQAELRRQLGENKLTVAEFERRIKELQHDVETAEADRTRQELDSIERTTRFVNTVLPPGWLPLGAMALAEANVVPALLGTLGLGLIGGASMGRAYRTTLRMYTGQVTGGKRAPTSAVAEVAKPDRPSAVAVPTGQQPVRLLERRLPLISEQAAAIALAGFRGLVRAPEAKMLLLSPIILLVVFGSMAFARHVVPPDALRPFIATGAIAMILLGMGQVICNQFGFDRSGFRVFVLSSARRDDILLGKNLAFAPLALGLSSIALIVVQVVYPMRIDHFLAALPQAVSMFLLYCFAANWLSILAPMAIAAGAMRPANTKMVPVLLNLAFTLLMPVILAPTLLPLAIESLVAWAGWPMLPVALVLSLALCAGVIATYRVALKWQGEVLQAREQRILQTVTSKVE
jgi:ABC-2 type transport system permease protein